MTQRIRDNRIFLVTRIVLAVVNLALFFAFLVLYLNPHTTRDHFAWEIRPYMTAVFMGAGYISGAYMFFFAIFGRKWHRVKNSFLPVSTFATVMLIVTVLHYDRFTHGNFAFVLWLIIYIVTPFLVPWLWFNNRRTDPGTFEANDRVVPQWVRRLAGLIGVVSILFWGVNFFFPTLLISIWPWTLSPLTARTVCAWGALVSVGGMVLSREPRWSAWRNNIQAIGLWQVLLIIGSIVHRADFHTGTLINPFFFIIAVIFTLLLVLYLWMEWLQPRSEPLPKSPGASA
jgi:hypothetical protein